MKYIFHTENELLLMAKRKGINHVIRRDKLLANYNLIADLYENIETEELSESEHNAFDVLLKEMGQRLMEMYGR